MNDSTTVEHRRDPHQHDVEERRDADHHATATTGRAGQLRVTPASARPCGGAARRRRWRRSAWSPRRCCDCSSHSKVYVPFCSSTSTGSCRCGPGSAMKSASAVADDVGGEVGVGVAVEELGDVLRRADDARPTSACSGVVAAGVGVAVGGDDRRVRRRCRRRSPRHRRGRSSSALAPSTLAGLGGHHEAVDRRLDGVLAVLVGRSRGTAKKSMSSMMSCCVVGVEVAA